MTTTRTTKTTGTRTSTGPNRAARRTTQKAPQDRKPKVVPIKPTPKPSDSPFAPLSDFISTKPIRLYLTEEQFYDFPGELGASAYITLRLFFEAAMEANEAKERGEEISDEFNGALTQDDVELLTESLFGGPEMVDQINAEVPNPKHIAALMMTLAVWHAYGEEAAGRVWAAGGDFTSAAGPTQPGASR